MSVMPAQDFDTGIAEAAAEALERGLRGATPLRTGPLRSDVAIAELLPADAHVILAVWLDRPDDEPTCVALALTTRLVGALVATTGAPVEESVAPEALAAVAGALGAPAPREAPSAVTAQAVAGSAGSRTSGATVLDGDEVVAAVVVRVGPDAPVATARVHELPHSGVPGTDGVAAEVDAHDFRVLDHERAEDHAASHSLDLIHDVEMNVTVELGRARLMVRELLALTAGAVIELDRAAGSPVDMLVNGTLIARGEVVVVDEEFGIRVTDIIRPAADERRAT